MALRSGTEWKLTIDGRVVLLMKYRWLLFSEFLYGGFFVWASNNRRSVFPIRRKLGDYVSISISSFFGLDRE